MLTVTFGCLLKLIYISGLGDHTTVTGESRVWHVFTCIYPACLPSSYEIAVSHIIRTIQRVTGLMIFKNRYIAIGQYNNALFHAQDVTIHHYRLLSIDNDKCLSLSPRATQHQICFYTSLSIAITKCYFTAPIITSLSTTWRWVVSFRPRPLYTPVNG